MIDTGDACEDCRDEVDPRSRIVSCRRAGDRCLSVCHSDLEQGPLPTTTPSAAKVMSPTRRITSLCQQLHEGCFTPLRRSARACRPLAPPQPPLSQPGTNSSDKPLERLAIAVYTPTMLSSSSVLRGRLSLLERASALGVRLIEPVATTHILSASSASPPLPSLSQSTYLCRRLEAVLWDRSACEQSISVGCGVALRLTDTHKAEHGSSVAAALRQARCLHCATSVYKCICAPAAGACSLLHPALHSRRAPNGAESASKSQSTRLGVL